MLSAAAALHFCSTSTSAVCVTVWPSGTGELAAVRQWLIDANARVVHEAPVEVHDDAISSLLTIMALYDGEEWLETNCWYAEQPLETGPPSGPWAGAKWKRALCYRNSKDRRPVALVADVSEATSSLWASKYVLRRTLAMRSGNPGNSCIHLTDEQDATVLASHRRGERRRAGGMGCDDSYAFACGRALLHPTSIEWINSGAAGLAQQDMDGDAFRAAWRRYAHSSGASNVSR